jgi:uronate dehydrogenase
VSLPPRPDLAAPRPPTPLGARAPVLLTGAAGKVATLIRPFLAQAGVLVRLSDLRSPGALAPTETFEMADLRDAEAISQAVSGCGGVVHLGGISKDRDFAQLVGIDMLGVAHVLEAARQNGVPRVVLASSMHVLGLYRRDEPVTAASAPRPDSRYAVARLFAEHAGWLYAAKHGLGITCLRLGHVTARREDAEPGGWVAPEDVAALVRLGLEHPSIRYEVIHAIAPGDTDDPVAGDLRARLGFTFRHRGLPLAEALAEAVRYFRFEPAAIPWRGGVFASRDGEPD